MKHNEEELREDTTKAREFDDSKIDKMLETCSESSNMVQWYAHKYDGTVRGGFGRWFSISGEDKHTADQKHDVEFAALALSEFYSLLKAYKKLKEERG